MIAPHACHGDIRFFTGPAGSAGSVRGRASVDTGSNAPLQGASAEALRSRGARSFSSLPSARKGPAQPATALMRAIISSTALSVGTFSLTILFIALAQTFSLFRIVNL